MLKFDSVRRIFLCIATTFLLSIQTHAQQLAVNSTRSSSLARVADDSLQRAKMAIAASPFEASGFVLAARYLDEHDHISLAAECYRAASLLDPAYEVDAARLAEDASNQRNRFGETALRLQAKSELFADDVTSLLELAKIRLIQGRTIEADKLVRRAAAQNIASFSSEVDLLDDLVAETYNIDNHLAHVILLDSARAESRVGRITVAAAAYKQLLREYPDNTLLHNELSATYIKSGDFRSAVSHLDLANTGKSDREKLFARDELLMRSGLASEAAQGLVEYYRIHPEDQEISRKIEALYPRLFNFPQARRLIEAVRPDLVTVDDDRYDSRIVQTARNSRFGLTAYPWVRYIDTTGDDYQYRDNAQGVTLTAFINGRTGFSFGASTHSITSNNTFTGLKDANERLSRIGVGIDLGGPEFTQQDRQGSYRFTLMMGLSAYSNGKTKPYAESTIEHVSRSGFRTGLELATAEGIANGVAPVASQFDSRVSSARAYLQNSFHSFVKFRGSLTILGVADEGFSQSNAIMGSDGSALVGLRVVPSLHVGVGYRQVDYERYVDVYWGPSLYRKVDAWTEYERIVDRTLVRFRTGLTSIIQSDRPVLPFAEGLVRGRVAEQATVELRAELVRDARSIRQLRTESADQLLTAVLIEAALTWHF